MSSSPYRDPLRHALHVIAESGARAPIGSTAWAMGNVAQHALSQTVIRVVRFHRDPHCPDRYVQYCDYHC